MKLSTPLSTILILLWSQDARGAVNRHERIKARLDAKSKVSGGEKIVGGETVIPNSIPYQISLQAGDFHFCGGAIVDERHILTAAHCCDNHEARELRIVAGEHDLKSEDGLEQAARVDAILMHERYDRDTIENDLCILTLREDLQFNSAVSAVALPAQNQEFASGTRATVSGWGYLSENGEPASLLQAAELDIISDAKCARAYAGIGGEARPHPETSICAKEKGKDSCQGDSGGPLTCSVGDGKADVICGVVSWGVGCARAFPGVYADVANYRDWIDMHSSAAGAGGRSGGGIGQLALLILVPAALMAVIR